MLHGTGALRAKDPRASTNIQKIRKVLLVLLVPVIIVALQAVSSPSDCSPPQHQDGNYGDFERKYYSIREVLGGYVNSSQEFYTSANSLHVNGSGNLLLFSNG
ncbi:hypothetical protein QYF36_004048 [Acer negundo]|nr:hypothetical protein QYF36_004048 [Acer negundo]